MRARRRWGSQPASRMLNALGKASQGSKVRPGPTAAAAAVGSQAASVVPAHAVVSHAPQKLLLLPAKGIRPSPTIVQERYIVKGNTYIYIYIKYKIKTLFL